ncbi:LOW QUALITY PROTEIN: UDP-glycosyltransferase 89B2-like [Dioscorea cayenensis subsp. rotundata]|uniref:LOW QUALITY PROTEIN: UDP-glycosyltransferase 89B2-like n=1 Tax=Dioscorea cayennensis subsp. rotundata TaxID=55577 RepID=A0AB40B0L9_DIOCR|nr:LOW QUALITY PROTEIN: UDP-glycosyltransferase 89B2-like [Dioscorea cayenensis subsp. rotundata]
MATTTQEEQTQTKPHILIIPYPAQGHMLPLLDFTHQLSLQNLTITILTTPKNLPLLSHLLSLSPSIQTLILPFPSHPSIPPNIENTKNLPSSLFIPMTHVLSLLYSPLLHWFKSTHNPPNFIISDFFLGWTQHLAEQLSIPRIVFSPSGAFTLSTLYSLWTSMPKNPNPDNPRFPHSFPNIPDSPTFPWNHLSTLFRSFKEGDPVSHSIRDGFLGNIESWGLVFNSFDSLESRYLQHLKDELGHVRVWAVGPLTAAGSTRADKADDRLIRWLDTCQSRRSVVYVCFGSQAELTWQQLEAVGMGLERSGARFVWCVRDTSAVPDEEFEMRVRGRGVVIRGWAPQVELLSHRAVGSFLTHCGWNSVLEAVASGVVMLTWPFGADQFVGARLMSEAGVAVRVCEGSDSVPDPDELGRILAESVGTSEVSRERRKRAVELREKALMAVKEGGSSFRDLQGFVKALWEVHEEKLKINKVVERDREMNGGS